MKDCTVSLLAAVAVCVSTTFNAQHVLASLSSAAEVRFNPASIYSGKPCHGVNLRSTHCSVTESNTQAGRQDGQDGPSASQLSGTYRNGHCFEYDIDYCGSDIQKLEDGSVPHPHACQHICAQTDGCTYWTYIPATSSCYLKSAAALQGKTRKDSAISGPRECPLTHNCYDMDTDYYGWDVKKIEGHLVISAEECQLICLRFPRCHFWTWVSSQRNCYLKNEHARRGRAHAPGSVSGPRKCTAASTPSLASCYGDGCDESECYEHNILFSEAKHDVNTEVLGSTQCQYLCQQHSDCSNFSYLPVEKKCMLGSSEGQKLPHKYAVSGPKFCSGTYCAVKDVEYYGKKIESHNVPSFAVCLQQCQQNRLCTAVTFDATSGLCLLVQGAGSAPAFVSGPKSCIPRDQHNGEKTDTTSTTISFGDGGSFCYDSGMAYSSRPLLVKHVDSAEWCQRRCRRDPRCKFFTYYLFGKTCLTHESEGQRIHSETAVSGPSVCLSSTAGCFYENVEVYGKDVGGCIVEDVVACQKVCQQNNQCSFFAYDAVSKVCFLRQHRGPATGTTSAPAFCGMPLDKKMHEMEPADSHRGGPVSLQKRGAALFEEGLGHNDGNLHGREPRRSQQPYNLSFAVPQQRRVESQRKMDEKLDAGLPEVDANELSAKPTSTRVEKARGGDVVPPEVSVKSHGELYVTVSKPAAGLVDDAQRVSARRVGRKLVNGQEGAVLSTEVSVKSRQESLSKLLKPGADMDEEEAKKVLAKRALEKSEKGQEGNFMSPEFSVDSRKQSSAKVSKPGGRLAEDGAKKIPVKPPRRKLLKDQEGTVVPPGVSIEGRNESPAKVVKPAAGVPEDDAEKVSAKSTEKGQEGNVVSPEVSVKSRKEIPVEPGADLVTGEAKKIPAKPPRRKLLKGQEATVSPSVSNASRNESTAKVLKPAVDLVEDEAEKILAKTTEKEQEGNVVSPEASVTSRKETPAKVVKPGADLAEDEAKKIPPKPLRRKLLKGQEGTVSPSVSNENSNESTAKVLKPDVDLAEDDAKKASAKSTEKGQDGNMVSPVGSVKSLKQSSAKVLKPGADLANDEGEFSAKATRVKSEKSKDGEVVSLEVSIKGRQESPSSVVQTPDVGVADGDAKTVSATRTRRSVEKGQEGAVVPPKVPVKTRRGPPRKVVKPAGGPVDDNAKNAFAQRMRRRSDGDVMSPAVSVKGRQESPSNFFQTPNAGLAEDDATKISANRMRRRSEGDVVPPEVSGEKSGQTTTIKYQKHATGPHVHNLVNIFENLRF